MAMSERRMTDRIVQKIAFEYETRRTKFAACPDEERKSRRSFLRRAVTTAVGVPGAIAAASSLSQAGGGDPFTPGTLPFFFDEILNDEAAHIEILQRLLIDPANTIPPRNFPHLRNLLQPSLQAFIEGAAAFENTGSGTYGGALFAVQQTNEYFPLAVGITTVEARHAGWLNAILKQPLVPDFFPSEGAIPQSTALSHVDPFIRDLNGSDVPSFDPVHRSDANNFAILDFLLLLEMVETAYYRVNLKKYFGIG
jgi:hypothetical protein